MSVQIVIPMSGFGERFRRAGYTIPKPLIEVEGKPIIAHVVDMFPGEADFTFICNQDHLNEPDYRMREILEDVCPTGRIFGVETRKLGPVDAVQQIEHMLDADRPVVVNYCDFTCYWDWDDFKRFVEEVRCAGAIPAYKGFHPHSLGSTNYAYMQTDGLSVLDIQEKKPYTDNRMAEYASSGTYYFRTVALMKEAFARQVADGLAVNGEFYVSLAYKPLLADGLPVSVYPLQHFMQWGTPEDVREYNQWSAMFHRLNKGEPMVANGRQGFDMRAIVVPMAGLGSRFLAEGYVQTKPLITVSGRPMVLQSMEGMPNAARQVFVTRADMPDHAALVNVLKRAYPDATMHAVDEVTEGQAVTALIGLKTLGTTDGAVTITVCDSGCLYDDAKFTDVLSKGSPDMVIWAVRGYANAIRNPQMYGWIDLDQNGSPIGVSVKVPLDNPKTDPVVLGMFTFRSAAQARHLIETLIARNERVNSEFYLDQVANVALDEGLTVSVFEVDHFMCWGTPNDLRSFEYWQSCFNKWDGHPYRLENDPMVPHAAQTALADLYAKSEAWDA